MHGAGRMTVLELPRRPDIDIGPPLMLKRVRLSY